MNLVESLSESVAPGEQGALNEETFKRVIAIERKRSDRSNAS
jgi:hypothetical protein